MRKTILITGASSGLGEGMARRFAAMGRDLALCARRVERLELLKRELQAAHAGIRVSIRPLDVDDYDAVFRVFEDFATEFGTLDRIVVNAGIALGEPIGTGGFDLNKRTAQTNFVGALAQCEAAMQIFRRQGTGHLVTISSMGAVRGLPRHITTYAASKAAVATLTEGIRAEFLGTPIKISTIYPGYIRTDLNAGAKKLPFAVSAEDGVRALVRAIEKEPAEACVPSWPWTPLGILMRRMPLRLLARMS